MGLDPKAIVTLTVEQAAAIRRYLGTRPHDEVAEGCACLDAALRQAISETDESPTPA